MMMMMMTNTKKSISVVAVARRRHHVFRVRSYSIQVAASPSSSLGDIAQQDVSSSLRQQQQQQQHHQQQQQQDPIERRPLIVRNLITARSKKVIDYEEALELQDQLVQLRKRDQIPDTMLLLQHPHIYTVGIRNQASLEEHLLISNEEAEKIGARIHVTGRGGDITYHGPGQLVVYPIMDLQHLKKNLRWYVNRLEEVMIRTVREVIYEKTAGKEIVDPFRIDSMVGVWIAAAKQHLHAKQQQQQRPQNQNQILLLQEYYNMNRKIGAVGIHMSRWVSSFGVALNVDTDLSMFSHIVPCGIADKDKTVTSIRQELKFIRLLQQQQQQQQQQQHAASDEDGDHCCCQDLATSVTVESVIPTMVKHFGEVFNRDVTAE